MNREHKPSSFPLRLPLTVRQRAIDLAQHEGISLNQFISLAVAEKIARMEKVRWQAEPPETDTFRPPEHLTGH